MLKGIRGLVAALVLGMAGAICNLAYLHTKTQEVAMEQFVGIKPNTAVKKGERITLEHLAVVSIPRSNVGDLKSFAVPQSAQSTVIGHNATRRIPGGSLVLEDDIRPPPPELDFGRTPGPNETSRERAMWIPFDSHTMIASLINPGDEVSVLLPKVNVAPRKGLAPTPAGSEEASKPEAAEDPSTAGEGTEMIGKFKVLAVGNRISTVDAMLASGQRPSQENILTVSVEVDAHGNLEAKAQRLWEIVRASNFQGVGILLHPRPRK